MSLNKHLEKLKEHAEELIAEVAKKDKLTAADLEVAEKAVCMASSIKQIENAELMEQGGYSGNYSYEAMTQPAMSYERGRSPITGRYVSRDSGARSFDGYSSRRYYDGGTGNTGNYSGHSKRDRMIAALEEMYDNAPTDHERNFVKEWLDRVNYRN